MMDAYVVDLDNINDKDVYTVVVKCEGTGKPEYRKNQVREDVLIRLTQDSRFNFRNIEVKDGKVVGTTGSLRRFGGKLGMRKPLFILSEMRADKTDGTVVGYRIYTGDGNIKAVRKADIIEFCDKFNSEAKKHNIDTASAVPIQNAMYVTGESKFIRGYIENQFDIEVLNTGKPSNVASADVKEHDVTIGKTKEDKKRLSDIYTEEQINELRLGKESGVNIRIYGNPKLSAAQMREIRKTLEDNLNPRLFCSIEFSPELMAIYRLQLVSGIDISKFVNSKYTVAQVIEISVAMMNGVNIETIADPSLSIVEMQRRRKALESKIWTEGNNVSVLELIDKYTMKYGTDARN